MKRITLVKESAQIRKFGKKPSCVAMQVKFMISINEQSKSEERCF